MTPEAFKGLWDGYMNRKKDKKTKPQRKSPGKASGEANTFTPAQIAQIFQLREYGRSWLEIAAFIGYSEAQFYRIKKYMNLDDSLAALKRELRNTVQRAIYTRATGMPKITRTKKIRKLPTGEEEITKDMKLSYLAPDPTAAELWMKWNQDEEIEVVPEFHPIDEVPPYEET